MAAGEAYMQGIGGHNLTALVRIMLRNARLWIK